MSLIKEFYVDISTSADSKQYGVLSSPAATELLINNSAGLRQTDIINSRTVYFPH